MEKKPSLLLIHQHYASPLGTAPTRSHDIALEFVEKGYEVTIFCGSFDRGGEIPELPYNVDRVEIPYQSNSGFLARIISFSRFTVKAIAKAFSSDWTHIYCTSTPLTVWIPGFLAAKFRKIPWTAEERDLWPEVPYAYGIIPKWVWWITLWMKKTMLKSASNIVVVTLPMLRYYTRSYNLKKAHIEIRPNFNILSDANEAAEAKKATKFVYAGSLGWVTETNKLVEIAEHFQNRNGGESLHIYGDGFYKETLQEASKKLGTFLQVHDSVVNHKLSEVLVDYEVGIVHFRPNKWFSESGSPNKIKSYQDAGLKVWSNIPIWGLKNATIAALKPFENKSLT